MIPSVFLLKILIVEKSILKTEIFPKSSLIMEISILKTEIFPKLSSLMEVTTVLLPTYNNILAENEEKIH
jgi:hypothetical protein